MLSPTKITQITPEQSARFGELVQEWIAIGLSTQPADFDKATEAALRAYALCNLAQPKIILRMSSPYGATLGGALAWALLREIKQHTESQVRSQVRSQVWSQVWSQVQSQVESQVGSQVWSQVGSQVWSQVRSQVESQVQSQVWSQVRSQVWSQVGSAAYNHFGGSFWASWSAYITFMRDVLGWRGSTLASFTIDEDLIRSCGWVWWHEDVLAISDRPCELHRDERGRLHNDKGPSIAYRDGWALWHWHGITVPDSVILRPEKITTAGIEKEQNAEVRRVMIERYGYGRYVAKSQITHQDQTGKLRKRRNRHGDEIAAVEVRNGTPEPDGSHKTYFLSVPPQCQTAIEAVAWTYGMTVDEYKRLRVRT